MICLLCGQSQPLGLIHHRVALFPGPVEMRPEPLVDRARRALAKHEAGYELIIDEDLLLAALQTYIKVHS